MDLPAVPIRAVLWGRAELSTGDSEPEEGAPTAETGVGGGGEWGRYNESWWGGWGGGEAVQCECECECERECFVDRSGRGRGCCFRCRGRVRSYGCWERGSQADAADASQVPGRGFERA